VVDKIAVARDIGMRLHAEPDVRVSRIGFHPGVFPMIRVERYEGIADTFV
jgi:hypothetical protein